MPKTVEVDETQFLANQNLAKTVSAMMGKPEARSLMLKAQKLAFPETVIPEIDAAKPVLDQVEALDKKWQERWESRDKAEKEREESTRTEKLKLQWGEGQKYIRDQGYDDEGLKAVEDFMQKHGVANHQIALAAFEREHPRPQVETPNGQGGTGSWGFFDPPSQQDKNQESFMKAMIESKGEDERALDLAIKDALAVARGQKRAA